MKHASYLITGIVSSAGRVLLPSGKKGLFTIVLEAIYESRRRQTEDTLRRFQHLIGDTGQSDEPRGADEPASNSGQ
jgi:hypothetical protein